MSWYFRQYESKITHCIRVLLNIGMLYLACTFTRIVCSLKSNTVWPGYSKFQLIPKSFQKTENFFPVCFDRIIKIATCSFWKFSNINIASDNDQKDKYSDPYQIYKTMIIKTRCNNTYVTQTESNKDSMGPDREVTDWLSRQPKRREVQCARMETNYVGVSNALFIILCYSGVRETMNQHH